MNVNVNVGVVSLASAPQATELARRSGEGHWVRSMRPLPLLRVLRIQWHWPTSVHTANNAVLSRCAHTFRAVVHGVCLVFPHHCLLGKRRRSHGAVRGHAPLMQLEQFAISLDANELVACCEADNLVLVVPAAAMCAVKLTCGRVSRAKACACMMAWALRRTRFRGVQCE